MLHTSTKFFFQFFKSGSSAFFFCAVMLKWICAYFPRFQTSCDKRHYYPFILQTNRGQGEGIHLWKTLPCRKYTHVILHGCFKIIFSYVEITQAFDLRIKIINSNTPRTIILPSSPWSFSWGFCAKITRYLSKKKVSQCSEWKSSVFSLDSITTSIWLS